MFVRVYVHVCVCVHVCACAHIQSFRCRFLLKGVTVSIVDFVTDEEPPTCIYIQILPFR